MTDLHKADLEFFEEAKRGFESNPRLETYRNEDKTFIALRYGEDRDCIQVYQLGEEIAFIHQYMQPAPPLVLVGEQEPIVIEMSDRTTPGGIAGRTISGKHMRSEKEIELDEKLAISILKAHPNGLVLRQLNHELRSMGYSRWTNGSASGYMRSMINKGLPIERMGYGRYRYTGGGE